MRAMKRNGRSTDVGRTAPSRDKALVLPLLALLATPLTALALLACAPPPPPPPEPVELRVLSYNLRHNVDFYDERMELMADGIAALKPDVIGLQEIEIAVEQGEILEEMIRERDPSLDYELRQVLKPGAAAVLTGEGVGIMSRYPVSDVAILEMDDARVSLFGRIADAAGHSLAFVSTHLTSDGGDELRALQASDTVAFLEDNAAANDARVLVGDFNADADDEAIGNVVAAGYTDSYLEQHGAEATAAGGNTSPVVLGKDNPPQDFRRRIDYVFARGAGHSAAHVDGSEVVLDEPRADGLYPSDHLGVLTTLRLERSTASEQN